jgi:hypothetical protein
LRLQWLSWLSSVITAKRLHPPLIASDYTYVPHKRQVVSHHEVRPRMH